MDQDYYREGCWFDNASNKLRNDNPVPELTLGIKFKWDDITFTATGTGFNQLHEPVLFAHNEDEDRRVWFTFGSLGNGLRSQIKIL